MIFRVNFALEKKIIFEAFTQLLSIFTDNTVVSNVTTNVWWDKN